MNKLYLLLPVSAGEKDDAISLLLDDVDFKDGQEAFDYLKGIYELVDTINYEDFEGIFDERQFSAFLKAINDDKKLQSQSPSPSMIARAFNNWYDYHDDEYVKVVHLEKREAGEYLKGYKDTKAEEYGFDTEHFFLLHGSEEVKNTIFNAYMQNEDDGTVALLNSEASRYNETQLQTAIGGEKVIPVKLLPVDFEALHQWFSKHRNPQRQFDENADKHRENPRLGGYISPLTYTKNEIEPFLHKAIGTKSQKDRNLFFFDRDKNVYLYFWNENTPDQLFHAYEIKPENEKEVNKILAKSGKKLKEWIDKLGGGKNNSPYHSKKSTRMSLEYVK